VWNWPRFVLGGFLAAVVIVVALLAVRKSPETAGLDRAGNQLRDEAPVAHFAPAPALDMPPPATASAPPVAAPAPPIIASVPQQSAGSFSASGKIEAAKAPATVNSSGFGGGAPLAQANSELAAREGRISQAAASAPAGAVQPALVSAQNVGVSGYFKKAGQQYVQMNNSTANNKQPDPFANVLSNFQMERQGRNVFVYDSDGSTYKGRVLDTTASDKLVRPKDRQTIYGQPNVVITSTRSESNYAFEVQGINNVLQKNITFTGNVVGAPTEDVVAASAVRAWNRAQNAPVDSLKTDSAAFKVQAQAPVQNKIQNANQSQQFPRITGKLKVDGGVYDIEAQPPQQ
ncbi:MAG TPA: hypothetical protein VGN61_06020, partial [Verrucomicrobiae bacterium]